MTDRVGISANGLAAVLFDMDGTLVDSEKLWTIALERLAAELGGVLSASARQAMVGQDLAASIALMHADLDVDADESASAARLLELTGEIFRTGLPWNPGARALLAAVRAEGLRTALVTATHRSLVELALDTIGRENFDVSVCGDEVARNKPDPEPYLRALRLLGLEAGDCVAIEDSPTGCAAAAAAGLPVLVVPSEVPVEAGGPVVVADTLAGVTMGDLHRLWAQYSGQLAARARTGVDDGRGVRGQPDFAVADVHRIGGGQ